MDVTWEQVRTLVISAVGLVVALLARYFEYIENDVFLTIFFAILAAWGIGFTYKAGENRGLEKGLAMKKDE